MPSKRTLSPSATSSPTKKQHLAEVRQVHGKIAAAQNAAAADNDPPLLQLEKRLKAAPKCDANGQSVVYWMRMEDIRVEDNRALAKASEVSRSLNIPLLVFFIASLGDYRSHDRGPRRIDFMLRNLKSVKEKLDTLNIPLQFSIHTTRFTLPEKLISLLHDYGAKHLFANMEYEVDELRRDIRVVDLANESNITCVMIHDKLLVPPGIVRSKQGKHYTVYSPWQKAWLEVLNSNLKWLDVAPAVPSQSDAIRSHSIYGALFNSVVPESLDGFECSDRTNMLKLWPASSESAIQMLDRFLRTKARASQVGDCSPLSTGAETSDRSSRVKEYSTGRNRADMDTSSRLSPYLASGIISARECVRQTMQLLGRKKVEASRETGVGIWVQELAWRDFYTHIMSNFPRVSMGRPFLEKFADVKWETNMEHLNAWKEGKTGVPIVDAAMRQARTQGWMHNRPRMITAMYLTKDLMLDWRLGEKFFMEQFIDGDLACNNGGWQWSASTGTDPQPYFRIFNPYLQSEKADPTGNYIRHFVPELRNIKGKLIHNPIEHMPKHEFAKLGYPAPIVDHKDARERALRRYKTPGSL